jgi:hypothetical protein
MSRSDPNDPTAVYLRDFSSSDFVIGKDKFENLEINQAEDATGFHFFKDKSKPLTRYVKRFILKQGKLSAKVCTVTLIKNEQGKFEPRFDIQIINLTKKAVLTLTEPVIVGEDRLVKAHVNLGDCHEELSALLGFLMNDCADVELSARKYSVITSSQKEQLDKAIKNSNKDDVLRTIAEKFGHEITEKDISIITKRKSALSRFKKLLEEPDYFSKYQKWLKDKGKSSRREDVWQHFFEQNTWIFGYGLQLVACESLDDRKLETIVVGADIFDGAGKRIDGLLKTKGAINRSLFTEIKLHDAPLLEKYDRPAVWVPAKDLRGAVGQIHKTLHKVNLKVSESFHNVRDKEGNPTGETLAFVRPRGIVLIGTLKQFMADEGFNDQMFASFELYRQQQSGLEILTYDELYERARFIIEDL